MISPTKMLLLLIAAAMTANVALAQDLVIAPATVPFYQLSDFRVDYDDYGKSFLVANYKRTRGKDMTFVRGEGKSKSGPFTFRSGPRLEESGEIRLELRRASISVNDVELYLTLGGKPNYLVSNVVRIGNPGPATSARPMNAEEKKAYDELILITTPPKNVPQGYQPLASEDLLVPGMPIKAGYKGEWVDAEFVGFQSKGRATVKYADDALGIRFTWANKDWIVVESAVLAKAAEDPGSYQASVRLLPGGRVAIPDGAVSLADDLKLYPGTPLLNALGSSFRDVVVESISFDKIEYRVPGRRSTSSAARTSFAITEETLKRLAEPGPEKEFAKQLETAKPAAPTIASRSKPSAATIIHHPYPVTIPVPPNAQILPADLKVEPGTPLASCYANKWNHVTVVQENEDGSVQVSWDKYSGIKRHTLREQLIIEDKTVAELRKKMKPPAPPLASTLRTWTDDSGKHKIEATYLGRTEKEVNLKTIAGKEIDLPIDKLSEKDRDLVMAMEVGKVEAVEDEGENPFAP